MFCAIDVWIVFCLLALISSCVLMFGPTSLAYVASLAYDPRTEHLYRQIVQSFQRKGDNVHIHARLWSITLIQLYELSRQEARRKLIQLVVCIACMIVYMACMTMFLGLAGVPIVSEHKLGLNGVLAYTYFYMVSFATIGYGDMFFEKTIAGLLAGVFTTMVVLITIIGFVAYVNFYLVKFSDRLIAGFDAAVGGDKTPDWLWQSLRDS